IEPNMFGISHHHGGKKSLIQELTSCWSGACHAAKTSLTVLLMEGLRWNVGSLKTALRKQVHSRNLSYLRTPDQSMSLFTFARSLKTLRRKTATLSWVISSFLMTTIISPAFSLIPLQEH